MGLRKLGPAAFDAVVLLFGFASHLLARMTGIILAAMALFRLMSLCRRPDLLENRLYLHQHMKREDAICLMRNIMIHFWMEMSVWKQ